MMTAGNRLGLPTNVSYCISHTVFENKEKSHIYNFWRKNSKMSIIPVDISVDSNVYKLPRPTK